MNIVEVVDVTPDTVVEPVSEDNHVWLVECQGGCGRRMRVTKRSFRPVEPYDVNGIDGDVVQINYTAPGPRRCIVCGPFREND